MSEFHYLKKRNNHFFEPQGKASLFYGGAIIIFSKELKRIVVAVGSYDNWYTFHPIAPETKRLTDLATNV